MKRIWIILINLVILSSKIYSQPGSLDNTFGNKGILIESVGKGSDYGKAVSLNKDGKIILAGYSHNGTNYDFVLAQFKENGTFDSSFGINGFTTVAIGSDNDYAYTLALQPDGKILMAGASKNVSDYDFSLARFNFNGSLDTSFSKDGKLTLSFGSMDDVAYSIAVQADNKIVAAGLTKTSIGESFALARFLSNGTIDTSFSNDGKLTTSFGTNFIDEGISMAIQKDNKILVGGNTGPSSISYFGLVRYLSNGSLDTAFSNDGLLTTDFGNKAYLRAIAIQSDGKIVASGTVFNGVTYDFGLVRYNKNGSIDNSFDNDGKIITSISDGEGTDGAYAIVIQTDGRIILAGDAQVGNGFQIGMIRYNKNGSVDTDFGTDGIVRTNVYGKNDKPYSIALQSDGKIILGGYTYNGTDYDLVLARYIGGDNIGIIDFSVSKYSVLIYPNPIFQSLTLEYTLKSEEEISIQFLDMQGKLVKTFTNKEKQSAGKYEKTFCFPENVECGNYILNISSPNGQLSLKIVKQ